VREVRLPGFAIADGEVPQWTDAVCEKRDDLEHFLKSRGFLCRKFWHPLHTQAPYRLPDSRFPVSTALCRSSLWLPSAFQLTDENVGLVCDSVRDFYEGAA
jgi:dTDP-4-amino-4,6-dideoxygalactose transaminase